MTSKKHKDIFFISSNPMTPVQEVQRQLYATKDVYKYSFYPRTICDWNRLSIIVTDVKYNI